MRLMRQLWLLINWRRRRLYRAAVAETRRWQREEREKMAQYCPHVRRIIADDGGRSWR